MSEINKAIIITGGIKRLGLAFAQRSLDMGYSVILHYHTSKEVTDELLSEKYAKRVFFIQKDLESSPEDLIKDALSLNRPIIGLVNNVSVFSEGNLSEPEHFLKTIAINTTAPVLLNASFRKHIGYGWIINITDANIHHPNLNYQNYRISKLFLEEITRQQAVLFAPKIRVNAIAPGAMLPSKGKEAIFSALAEKIPLRSTGDLKSLVDAYTFLIDNQYITGQILRVDGGWGLI